MLTTYVINLERSAIRKNYMEQLIRPYTFLNISFIKAIDGNSIEADLLESLFDDNKCFKRYGRQLNPGEKGCVLSHRKCYQTLLDSEQDYVLILEDDINIVGNLERLKDINIKDIMSINTPLILFLSGDYWYFRRKYPILNVYTAIGSYAYIINRAAAQAIMSIKRPFNVSDDWSFYKQFGLNYKAFIPYLIDANLNMELLGSNINQYSWGINRKLMSKDNVFKSYMSGIIKHILKATGHFESKVKVRNRQIIPGLR